MRLIDADAMEKDLREQFEQVFTLAGRKVKPDDYYILRRETYLTDVRKAEYDSFFEYLKTRPTISPDSLVKRGWWDDSGTYRFEDGSIAIRCSECGAALTFDEWTKYHWNYCPNCGAKMED